MNFALLAALTIVSLYAILQHRIIKRMSEPFAPPPLADANEAGEAVLDAVEASLRDGTTDWQAVGGDIAHRESGFRVRVPADRKPRLFKNGLEFDLPDWRRTSLMRAIEMGNARDAVAALTHE